MKRQIFTLFTAGIFCASLTAGAFAASPIVNTEKNAQVSQLEQQVRRLESHAQATKGGLRSSLELQSLQVKQLIQRLEAGETVDPQEIDKLLKERTLP